MSNPMKFQLLRKIFFLALFIACTNFHVFCEKFVDDKSFPVKLIKRENYPVEVHEVITEDGYVLTFHRIPGSLSSSIPAYIQHGLLSSSGDWIVSGKNESLAYFLWDNGFDVWLGNARGNTYSKKHKTLSTEDPKFWNFSFHELGIYDVPANINYITRLTKKKIYYIGHSMACSTYSIMAINRPEVAKNVRAMIALAPAPYEFHVTLPLLKFFSQNWKSIATWGDDYGLNALLPRNPWFDLLADKICRLPSNPNICKELVYLVERSNPERSLVPLILKSFPSGTSMKLFVHWLQHIQVNEFRQFDYGPEGNLKIYGNSTPPNYDLTKLQTPTAVFYSDGDLITPSVDCIYFYKQLPFKLGLYNVGPSFSHSDFLWGTNTQKLLKEPILKILKSQK